MVTGDVESKFQWGPSEEPKKIYSQVRLARGLSRELWGKLTLKEDRTPNI